MKKILSLLLVFSLLIGGLAWFAPAKVGAASNTYVAVNNMIITNTDISAQLSSSLYYVPLQVLTDYLGFTSSYDSYSDALTLSYNKKVLYFNRKIGLAVDKDNEYYPYTFYIYGNSFMIPAQFICGYFGLSYSYYPSSPSFVRILSTTSSITDYQLYQNYNDYFHPAAADPQVPPAVYNKRVFITFDNCPNENTAKILDTLDAQNVKATFFVTTEGIEEYPDLIFRMIASGHQIGLNGSAALPEKPTAQDILSDFETCRETLYKTAKINSILIRSPKGSKEAFTKEACDLLTSGGYRIWDYNIQSGDTPDSEMSYYTIYANITNLLKERKSSAYIVLSNTKNTNNVLLQLLYYLRNEDFNTYTISYMVTPVNQWKDTR